MKVLNHIVHFSLKTLVVKVKLLTTTNCYNMGQLKPGATYIYERDGGTVYAREMGADPNTRVAIGWDYDPKKPRDGRETFLASKEARLWRNIRETAKANTTLQRVLDRAILVYNIVKDKK